MAASTDNALRSGAPRFSLKFTIFGQVILLLFLVLTTTILLAVESRFNLIQNAVYSIRTFSIMYGILQCVLYGIVFREKDTDPVAYRTSNRVAATSKLSGVLKCALLFSLSCVVLHIVLVLFGAAVQEVVEETSILAVLLSTLSTLPCLCLLGHNGEAWNRFTAQRRLVVVGWSSPLPYFIFTQPHPGLETCIQYAAVASLLGAWMGAFTIPLDWDRPWQVWPIPCAIGALWGHTAGLVVGFVHLVSLMSKQHTKGKNKYF